MPTPDRSISPVGPTPFDELNTLLKDFVHRVTDILGDNFLGAYLQGSFAVGDADMQSDCDFLVVTHGPLMPAHEARLRQLHDEIPTRPGHWTRHLEGSYPPKGDLRTLDGLGRRWLYIDHGWREMQWSTHCNTEVVRWSLREHGVTLAGPDPRELVDAISPEALRARMRQYAVTFLPELFTWLAFDTAWAQRYAVATCCRILHTLDSGRVGSKKAAMLWAINNLDPTWRSLIQQSLDDRPLGWDPDAPPRPGSAEATLAFVAYAEKRATTN